jgi:ribosomal subunit interface protein
LRERIESRLTGNLAKYFDGTVRAHIVVELQKQRFHTECTLHLSTGLTMQSHGEGENANLSFDMAAERLEKQLRRYKRRLRDYHPERREPADQTSADEPGAATQGTGLRATELDGAPAIIAEPLAQMSELSVGEAVSRLDESELPFVVFRNGQHGAINVVYRRRDGLIGWIDPGATTE